MNKLAIENALRWVLAAWTLMVSVFAPSTVVHRHSGGNIPHQHYQSDRAPDASSYSLAPRPFPEGYEGWTCPLPADLHKHPGLFLLGAVKHLPATSQPVNSNDESSGGWETYSTILSARGLRTGSANAAADDFDLVPVADLCAGYICSNEQREVPAFSVAPCSQLCDRARHERSGVQLA